MDRVGRTFDLVIFGPAVNSEQRAGVAPCLDLVGSTAGLHLPCASLSLKHGQSHGGAAQQMEFLCRAPALLLGMFLGGKRRYG